MTPKLLKCTWKNHYIEKKWEKHCGTKTKNIKSKKIKKQKNTISNVISPLRRLPPLDYDAQEGHHAHPTPGRAVGADDFVFNEQGQRGVNRVAVGADDFVFNEQGTAGGPPHSPSEPTTSCLTSVKHTALPNPGPFRTL